MRANGLITIEELVIAKVLSACNNSPLLYAVKNMALTTKQKQELKAKAHPLKPVVLIGGKGLTPAVIKEIDIALAHHELIKVRVASKERVERQAALNEISSSLSAELVQVIGSIGVIYRLNELKPSVEEKADKKADKNKKAKKRAIKPRVSKPRISKRPR